MAKNKFYAVKIGRTTGVFFTWDECKSSIDGYSGADYKSFHTQEEAEAYINNIDVYKAQIAKDVSEGYIVAYTDGSYDEKTADFSYGVLIVDLEFNEIELCSKLSYKQFAASRNIAGEVFGVLTALDWAMSNGYDKIKIYHDLESVSKWAQGEFNADSDISRFYVERLSQRFNGCIDYQFSKVKGHSNNPYNERADKLASSAFSGERKIISGANSFTVNGIEKDEIETIIGLIKEENEKIKEETKEILGGKQIKLSLSKKNSVIIKIFENKKVLVQGKTNALFQMVLTYISELLGEKDIIPLVKQAYRISINKAVLESNYANLCINIPETYNQNIKKLIRQAIINLNSYFEAEEYGQYAFPALKALEGHIKYLFSRQGVMVEKRFEQFDFDSSSNTYKLKSSFSIAEPYKSNIEKCYNHYYLTRHKVCHFGDIMGDTDNTFLITKKEDADEIINQTISLINNTVS